MNTNEFEEKIDDLLSDNKTYLKITDKRRNPTSKLEKELTKLLQDVKKTPAEHDPDKKQIHEKLCRTLHSTDGTPARFYGLPKIYKHDVPLRPITSCINFPTYQLSKHLVNILSPLLHGNHTVKNSSTFSQHIRDKHIADDEIMVSFDVISLFTSIPINLSLQVVKLKLQDDHLLPDRTDISVCNIMKLLEFVLHNSFFTYKEQHYQQISGCAMGSPISATIADLVMEHIEDIAISTAPHPPNWWFRYVDDSHSSLKREYVDEFHHHLNSINYYYYYYYYQQLHIT